MEVEATCVGLPGTRVVPLALSPSFLLMPRMQPGCLEVTATSEAREQGPLGKLADGKACVPVGITALRTCPGLPNLDFSHEKNKTSQPVVSVTSRQTQSLSDK